MIAPPATVVEQQQMSTRWSDFLRGFAFRAFDIIDDVMEASLGACCPLFRLAKVQI